MKNKIQLIDVSLISAYMGRWLTAVVALVVIGMAISAFLGGGSAQRSVIDVRLGPGLDKEATAVFEPFRALLARQTRRAVVLASSSETVAEWDLYILPLADFLDLRDEQNLSAIYEVRPAEVRSNDAIFITRAGGRDIEIASLTFDDLILGDPSSPNSFWLPVERLADEGVLPPSSVDAIASEHDRARIVYSVLFGEHRLGACQLTDLTTLIEAGAIRHGELSVVRRFESLPELVIASRATESEYYSRKIGEIEALLNQDVSSVAEHDTVELLRAMGVRGLHAIEPSAIDRALETRQRMRELFGPEF